MAAEKTDATMILNRLRMARELEDECLISLSMPSPTRTASTVTRKANYGCTAPMCGSSFCSTMTQEPSIWAVTGLGGLF